MNGEKSATGQAPSFGIRQQQVTGTNPNGMDVTSATCVLNGESQTERPCENDDTQRLFKYRKHVMHVLKKNGVRDKATEENVRKIAHMLMIGVLKSSDQLFSLLEEESLTHASDDFGVALVSPPTCGDVSMQKLSVDEDRKAETCPARGGTSCVVSVSDSAKEIQSLSVAEPASHQDTPELEGEPQVSSSTHNDLLPGTAYREEEEEENCGGQCGINQDSADIPDSCEQLPDSRKKEFSKCSMCGLSFGSFLNDNVIYRCLKCVRLFPCLEEFTVKKLYKCSACGIVITLRFPVSAYGEQKYTCQTCGGDLLLAPSHKCDTCGQSLPTPSALKQHMKTHLLRCEPCGLSFTRKFDWDYHVKKHRLEKRRKCSLCKKSCPDEESLKAHMETKHMCSFCGKIFKTAKGRTVHLREHNGDRPYQCSVCGKMFRDCSVLCRHQRTHSEEKPYKCKQCEKTFRQSYTLSFHVLTVHKKIKPHKCGICGKSFYLKWQLTNHSATHTDDGHFKCTVCSQEFPKEEDLQGHKKTHAKLVKTTNAQWKEKADPKCRIYQCTLCTKTYSSYQSLWYHKKTHSNTKHECSICGKIFGLRNNLHKHMKVHSGEKVFCSICGKALSSKMNLSRHMKRHRDERNFACTICSKRFLTSYDLTVHMPVHTGQKPYPCPICHKAFSHPSSVSKHKKLFHS